MTVDVKDVYREFDVSMDRIVLAAREQGHDVPCKQGCDACCYDIAFTSETEMGPAIERIKRMSPHRQAKILAAAADWERRLRGVGIDPDMEPEDHPPPTVRQTFYSAHAACPLLDQERHRCMVYEERPIACRGHWLINEPASKCANIDKDPVTQNIANTEPFVAAVLRMYVTDPVYRLLPRVLQKMLKEGSADVR